MMREIKFRGKRIDNGEWVEGFPVTDQGIDCGLGDLCICPHDGVDTTVMYFWDYYLHEFDECDVDPETVGQYTGLNDCNGNRIFEGDILEFEDLGEEGYEYKEGFDFINTASVVFSNGRFELENFMDNNSGVLEEMNNDHEDFVHVFKGSKIIGNRWDNPELLEVQE